jgi:hypothetical protein
VRAEGSVRPERDAASIGCRSREEVRIETEWATVGALRRERADHFRRVIPASAAAQPDPLARRRPHEKRRPAEMPAVYKVQPAVLVRGAGCPFWQMGYRLFRRNETLPMCSVRTAAIWCRLVGLSCTGLSTWPSPYRGTRFGGLAETLTAFDPFQACGHPR